MTSRPVSEPQHSPELVAWLRTMWAAGKITTCPACGYPLPPAPDAGR